MASAISETVESQLARILAREHGRPGGNGNGRNGAPQFSVYPLLHEPIEGGKFTPPGLEYKLRGSAVQSDDEKPSHSVLMPLSELI